MIQGVGVNSCFSKKVSLKIFSKSIVGVFILLNSLAASADQSDTLTYLASVGINYNYNVYKLAPGVNPQQAIGQSSSSDIIQTQSIGINLDKKYSNEEVTFRGSITKNKYNAFSNLDYTSTTYNAAWNGNLTSRLSVGLSDSRTQTLNTFTDIHVYTRNLTTTETPHLSADLWFQSNWHLTFGLTKSTTTTSQSVINNQSFTSNIVEWGAKCTPTDGSSISLISRLIQIENIDAVPNYALLSDTGNKESQLELNFTRVLTGKSSLNGNLLSINHQYPNFYQRDYSGVAGGINYSWGVSGKTSLNVSWNRAFASWIDVGSSYSVTDTASMSTGWQISTKIGLNASISHSKANFFGPIVPNTTARFDETQSESMGFSWSPQRSLQLTASFQNSHRYSNNSTFEYSDRSASFSAQLNF
jgi:exopolysaccharide biosynthesis operon protein EpsL